jgi:hypothetical protein
MCYWCTENSCKGGQLCGSSDRDVIKPRSTPEGWAELKRQLEAWEESGCKAEFYPKLLENVD